MYHWNDRRYRPWFPIQRHEWDSTGRCTGKKETWEEFEKRRKERYAEFDQMLIQRTVTDEERQRAKETKARLLARVLPVPDPVDGVDGSEDNTQ
jgi:hypothetical protein